MGRALNVSINGKPLLGHFGARVPEAALKTLVAINLGGLRRPDLALKHGLELGYPLTIRAVPGL